MSQAVRMPPTWSAVGFSVRAQDVASAVGTALASISGQQATDKPVHQSFASRSGEFREEPRVGEGDSQAAKWTPGHSRRDRCARCQSSVPGRHRAAPRLRRNEARR